MDERGKRLVKALVWVRKRMKALLVNLEEFGEKENVRNV